ncbi:MAG: threonine--tRNA ligase, partial [Candidatus Odinarchaeota archaeon]|nr:threonine--tRNA ligase [Candidatus Odinarchaeota archaeon]
ARKLPLIRKEISKEEARRLFKDRNEEFKLRLLDEIEDEIVSVYWQGDFVDLCRGPHLPHTGYVKHFKLTLTASAYWHGLESEPVMQRIYGISFPEKSMLDEYLTRLEEIKRRDHRRLGVQLDLFSTHELLGAGLVLWHPKGAILRELIQRYLVDLHLSRGYEIVVTPHIAKSDLYKTSGHLEFYRENMYLFDIEGVKYALKPMNCPMHILIYKRKVHSYKDLPVRYFELGTVYRYERSGVLKGLLRVRGFTQDDAHIFCRPDQLEDEIIGLIELMMDIYRDFGFVEFEAVLSTRDPDKPEEFMGSDEIWEHAESKLKAALEKKGIKYKIAVGEAAFYGPKIDAHFRDSLNRLWQCATIQVDFNLPQRFKVTYIDVNNEEKLVVMLHRALLGSIERFVGLLVEQYGGALPLWVAPVQAVIIPVSDPVLGYAKQVYDRLKKAGIRVELDDSKETVSYRVRLHITNKIPYILVVGKREESSGTVAVRIRGKEGQEVMSIDDFINYVKEKVESKSIEY